MPPTNSSFPLPSEAPSPEQIYPLLSGGPPCSEQPHSQNPTPEQIQVSPSTISSLPTSSAEEFLTTTSSAPGAVLKKRGRKKRVISEEEQTIKREHFLQRNRIAAGKCRHGKKTQNEMLRKSEKELKDTERMLRLELAELRAQKEQREENWRRHLLGCRCESDNRKLSANISRYRSGSTSHVQHENVTDDIKSTECELCRHEQKPSDQSSGI